MSKRKLFKLPKPTKGKKEKRNNTGIIHVKNSKSRGNKVVKKGIKGKDCIYFDCTKLTCNNSHSERYKHFCNLCNSFISKNKCIQKKPLSDYDENHLQLPEQVGIHESDNRYIGASKNIGTPCHIGFIRSDGIRRHKARCIYYNKVKNFCTKCLYKCIGSSKCNNYMEESKE